MNGKSKLFKQREKEVEEEIIENNEIETPEIEEETEIEPGEPILEPTIEPEDIPAQNEGFVNYGSDSEYPVKVVELTEPKAENPKPKSKSKTQK